MRNQIYELVLTPRKGLVYYPNNFVYSRGPFLSAGACVDCKIAALQARDVELGYIVHSCGPIFFSDIVTSIEFNQLKYINKEIY